MANQWGSKMKCSPPFSIQYSVAVLAAIYEQFNALNEICLNQSTLEKFSSTN